QFRKPARMLSIFPSVSDPNWNAIFGLERPLGFTKNTFDPKANQGQGGVVGSILSHLIDHPEYEKRFDHNPKTLVQSATNFAWIEASLDVWIQELPLRILETKGQGRTSFYAFTLNTDLIAHTQGEEAVLKWMKKISMSLAEIEDLYQKRGLPKPEIILISDHGNTFYEKVELIDVVSHLTTLGWKRSEQETDEKSYIFVAPEILSVAGFWTKNPIIFAKDLATLPHVLWSAVKTSPSTLEVFSRFSEPIRFTKGKTSKHPSLKSLELDGKLDQTRIWEAFDTAAKEPPSVVAVSERGTAFSNQFLKIVTKLTGLHSLHGSLFESESTGIFTSNVRDFPDIRPWEFSDYVDIREFQPRY
ncbi:MAG: hypothetical protein K2X47_17895, partial [Bdellovibrionales bacterium]|nr:hypothetical protein [Bdellovibrionales bacterium]